jgi:hypothetical protein
MERLEQKSEEVETLLKQNRNDWENVLFVSLLKNFGLNINGEAFMQMGLAIEFGIIRKIGNDVFRLESLLFGQSGLLGMQIDDTYYQALKAEYAYLRKLYGLKQPPLRKPEYKRLRPSNFPSLRLAQFAALCASQPSLFSQVTEATCLGELYDLFACRASRYWNSHYDFGKTSPHSGKPISRSFIQLLLINTVFPLRYCYARHQGDKNLQGQIEMLVGIPAEKNRIINSFGQIGIVAGSARESQAMLQLYHEYCSRYRCLHCAIGCSILTGK